MTQTVIPARRTRTRVALMMSCASVAIAAMVLGSEKAEAQAFIGTPTTASGTVSYSRGTPGVETITLGSNTATINWTPTNQQQGGGAIDFLPAGNTATFTSAQAIADFTVLNRIVPASGQPIAFNGHVVSELRESSQIGGHVWFYAPGGIVVGSTAVFDVGSLLLTTNNVTNFNTSANGFSANFSGPSGSRSSIQIQNGAQINAIMQNGSYVALVAPRIEQGGKIRVNGSAAYAAGEQLTMTMNQGLFDIQVDVGTSDSNGVVHTGETSGPANVAAGDNHSIYMVAVPKNQALTMLLSGGTVGFDATSASIQNGQIILSSGAERVSGMTIQRADQSEAVANPADLSISGGTFTSSVTALATGNIQADGGGGALAFAGDASLQGLQSARLTAHDEETVTVGGNLTLSADDLRNFIGTNATAQVDARGGDAALLSEIGGSIAIAGSATVTANASPTVNTDTGYGGTSRGGTATVDTTGGAISVGGNLTVSAAAFGDAVSSPGIDGRDSWGGDANIFASGGALQVGGNVNVSANGTGSWTALASGTGGTGFGGNAGIVADSGGSIDVHGSTAVTAMGFGGGVVAGTSGAGGDGLGGVVTVGSAGIGQLAALGTNTSMLTFGSLGLNAKGQGADGSNGPTGGAGGHGQGGDASLLVSDSTMTADTVSVFARGVGGTGGNGSAGAGGNGGSGTGGTASLWVDSTGSLTATEYEGSTNGLGGDGGVGSSISGDGGFGQSGWDSASIDGAANFTTTDPFHGFVVTSYAEGGAGNVGGSATAGSSSIDVSGSLSSASHVQASAQAGGGTGDTVGGTADAGTASISVPGHLDSATLFVGNNATGGNGAVAGGDAYGGSGSLYVDGGAVQVSGAANFGQTAVAGSSSNGALGFASGGSVDIESSDGGSFDADNLSASTNANSGPGGFVGLFASGGSISANSLILSANGTTSGGSIALGADSSPFTGDAGLMSFGSVDATANGGDNGGSILVATGSGSMVDLGDASLRASGAFAGSISLLAGTCFECGGGEDFASPASPALPAGGGIAATDLTLDTSGNIFVGLSGGADVSVSGNLTGNAGQYISLFDDGTGGAIRGDTIDLTSITINSNARLVGNLVNLTTASDMNVGDVQASQSANFTAGGLATFNGDVSSPTITVTSSDIDIGSGASLGVTGVTNLLTLNALSSGQPIILGNGPAAPGQYHLGGEAGDIRATSVVINAQGTAPDVQIFDATIDGSATTGGGITNLTLNTGGSVFVNGLVDWINAGASDALTINAGNSIQVNTDTGGIQMTDSGGNLAGELALNANNVWVASGAVLGQLQANVNFSGRDAALGTNSGSPNQQGFIRAGTITAGVANTFLVQNSGTPQLFAGIDTGAGGLSVDSTGTTPAILIIYGRQTAANGTVITNEDFLGSVAVGGAGGFTPDSSVNGCEIGSAASCNAPTFFFDNSSLLGPLTKDDDDKKKQQDQAEGDTRVDPSMRLINTAPINIDHTINDPVTSGGDVIMSGPVQPN